MSTLVVLLSASEHRHKMSARTYTVYKYVKELYPISKEHQVENSGLDPQNVKVQPWVRYSQSLTSKKNYCKVKLLFVKFILFIWLVNSNV
jgi:hypothetical protein